MNNAFRLTLKTVRRIYHYLSQKENQFGRNWKMFSKKEYANQLIYEYLMKDEACMIARFGAVELNCLLNYLGVKQHNVNLWGYVKGDALMWWWEPENIKKMQLNAGFFPPKKDKISAFCELMLEDLNELDLLGSWLKEEKYFSHSLTNSKQVVLEDLEPFFATNPWTRALANKTVLVVHPFADTIEQQYKRKDLLFNNGMLPEFKLKTIKAVQSVAGTITDFEDWFEALDWMKNQIDNTDFDICIIGCGAYGFPLAAHVKRMGKKSIHLGGATQLLFGIKGKRWENYIVWPYTNLFNEHWVRPGEREKPKNANVVEGACYW